MNNIYIHIPCAPYPPCSACGGMLLPIMRVPIVDKTIMDGNVELVWKCQKCKGVSEPYATAKAV